MVKKIILKRTLIGVIDPQVAPLFSLNIFFLSRLSYYSSPSGQVAIKTSIMLVGGWCWRFLLSVPFTHPNTRHETTPSFSLLAAEESDVTKYDLARGSKDASTDVGRSVTTVQQPSQPWIY